MYDRIERKAAKFWARKNVALRHNTGVVSFTFDDVPKTACHEGARILESHGVRGTYYVCGGLEAQDSPSGEIHTKDDLQKIAAEGHEIGSHGYGHLVYQKLSAAEIDADIAKNNDYFADLGFDLPPPNFAYPFGMIGLTAKSICGKRFVSARGVKSGINIGDADFAQLRSLPLYDAETTTEQVTQLLRQTRDSNGWLIFTSHGVLNDPDPYSSSPNLLEHAVKTALDLGNEVLPVRNAIGLVAHRPSD